jgi:hypothetical protein
MDFSDKIQSQALIVSTVMNLKLPQREVISTLSKQLFTLWTLLHRLVCYYKLEICLKCQVQKIC